MKLDEVLNEDERLGLWVEMMVMATAIQEYADWWWQLDPGLRRANAKRAGVDEAEPEAEEISG